MEIEVKKLSALRKYTGSFSFDYLPPADICMIPLCKVDDVKVSGEYEIYDDDSVGVKLKVEYRITGKCSYCLADAEKQFDFSTEVLYVPEKDDDNYYYDGIKIKLDSAVDDAILVSQPSVLLCSDDCKGIDVT